MLQEKTIKTSSKEWRPNPGAQEKALASPVYELLFGGAAGGGKSDFLLVDALAQVRKPAYKAILFRRSYPELERSLILRSQELYPSEGGRYQEQKHRWTFPSGAIIDFGYLDNDKAVFDYQSAAYAYLGFDEATHFTEFQIEYLKSRCRCADPDVQKYIRYTSNPGNIGHTYFKKRFIDNKVPFKTYHDAITGLSMKFIPSKVFDNFVLMKADPEYVKRLEGLPDNEKKKLLHGSWDVMEGQYFGEFRTDIHVIEPFTIPKDWKRYAGIDYGLTAPFAGLFVAIDYDGNPIVYKEYYQAGKTAFENGLGMQALYYKDDEPIEHISGFFADPSIFGNSGSGRTGETIAEILKKPLKDLKLGINYHGLPVVPASNRRIDGWNTIREYLLGTKGKKLKIFNNCFNLIRTFPEMMYDLHDQEDLNTKLEDHALDALRYVLQTLRDKKTKEPEAEHITLEARFKARMEERRNNKIRNLYNGYGS